VFPENIDGTSGEKIARPDEKVPLVILSIRVMILLVPRSIQNLFAVGAVEALDVSILRWFAGLYMEQFNLLFFGLFRVNFPPSR